MCPKKSAEFRCCKTAARLAGWPPANPAALAGWRPPSPARAERRGGTRGHTRRGTPSTGGGAHRPKGGGGHRPRARGAADAGAAGHDTARGRGSGRAGQGGPHPAWPQKPLCIYICIGFQAAGSGKCTAVLLNGSKIYRRQVTGLQLESPSACLYIQSSMRGRAQPLQMETPRPTARSAGPATDRPRESAGHGGGARLGGRRRAEKGGGGPKPAAAPPPAEKPPSLDTTTGHAGRAVGRLRGRFGRSVGALPFVKGHTPNGLFLNQ